jgi:L-lactate utilization protein LutB
LKRFLSSLFGSAPKQEEKEQPERSKYMPAQEVPIEESFTLKFTQQGGKFIYCENTDEALRAFDDVIKEKKWTSSEMLCFDTSLLEHFQRDDITPTKTNLNAKFLLTSCEFLVAHDGSIIMCDQQIANHKLADLPECFVIFAGTKQLTDTLSEGLKGIKHKYKKNIPINITSIKHFKKSAEENQENFLTYGLPIKDVFLILLEDF